VSDGKDPDLLLSLPCDRHAPGFVRSALDGIDGIASIRDDAKLIASELVTNAVLHSGCSERDTIDVRATASSDRLILSVHDPGPKPIGLNSPAHGRLGGLGLRIVQQLATAWGAEHPDRVRVWAELAIERW